MTHQTTTLPLIRQLPDALVDQIAAGEVVERPASVVKELVENALDAGTTSVHLIFEQGGKKLIDIRDNGCGMSASDLALAVSRHATSKLASGDLHDIQYFGFRGEALASIAAVSRLTLESRQRNASEAWFLSVEGGRSGSVSPSSWQEGTHIQVKDLFFAVPARLKFLKTDNTEKAAILDIMRRIALVNSDVAFRVEEAQRLLMNLRREGKDIEGISRRVYEVLGRSFRENSLQIGAEREFFRLYGLAGLPTAHKANSTGIYVFVNKRPLRDRNLMAAIRAGYSDLIPSGRYPEVVLFIDIAPHLVDVNVHPAKSEVRFQDPAHIRGLIVSSLRTALSAQLGTASTISKSLSQAFSGVKTATSLSSFQGQLPIKPASTPPSGYKTERPASPSRSDLRQVFEHYYPSLSRSDKGMNEHEPLPAQSASPDRPDREVQPVVPSSDASGEEASHDSSMMPPLGFAKGQIHSNYIISETEDGMIIVDQHAAHERLVYEGFKKQVMAGGIERQSLLVPEVLEFAPDLLAILLDAREELSRFGLVLEDFGKGAIALSEVPSLVRHADFKTLLTDIAEDWKETGSSDRLEERLNAVISRMACHGSVRSGRRLERREMDHLLRDIEANPVASQCNHGRPTFIRLSLSEIEKLFARR